ncbi:MAG: DUF6675 family protein [Spirochaetales bacterium]
MKKSRLATTVLALAVMGPVLLAPATLAALPTPEGLSADLWAAFLPAKERQTLLATGELTAIGSRAEDLPFGAKSPFASELSGLTVKSATVAAEGLFLFPRPAGDVPLALYNAVNSVASMEGLQYFSVTRQRRETLILTSYRVASKGQPTRLADPVFTTIPPVQKAVVFQKDNKLGDGFSELAWKALDGGGVALTFRNLDTLNYTILPLVDPGNLQMLFVVQPLADKVAVYGLLLGKTVSLFGLERSKDESFRNRMRALADWLGTRIAALSSR